MVDNWIFSGPRNGLFAKVDGKTVPLRYSVHQARAYADHLDALKKRNESREKFDAILQIREMVVDALDIALIAFNPEPDKLDYPRELLESKFDADQLRILAEEWQKRKIYDPQAARDPDPLRPQPDVSAK
jgi:hypothetical protein